MIGNQEFGGHPWPCLSCFDMSAHKICIAVAAHKPYRMPSDPMYMPMHVGKAMHPNLVLGDDFITDDGDDNISSLNPYYSELTAVYWMWKNNKADYKGLVHYRRLFATRSLSARLFAHDPYDAVATSRDIEALIRDGYSIILPHKRYYVIETIYSHYMHTAHASHLDETRRIMQELEPDFLKSFDSVMRSRSAHMFNMFVMSRERFDEYCAWLFPILDELVRRIDPAQYDPFTARYPGRISEMLLDVWIGGKGYRYAEMPTVSPEPVDWNTKIRGFLAAKFAGRKYGKSF